MWDVPESKAAILEAIRHWLRLTDLAEFAAQRHGYGDDNGGFGVTYPGDLDEYDREVDGIHIPEGFVQVYGFWGPPDGYQIMVTELEYLETLAGALSAVGHAADAERVKVLAARQRLAQSGGAADGGV